MLICTLSPICLKITSLPHSSKHSSGDAETLQSSLEARLHVQQQSAGERAKAHGRLALTKTNCSAARVTALLSQQISCYPYLLGRSLPPWLSTVKQFQFPNQKAKFSGKCCFRSSNYCPSMVYLPERKPVFSIFCGRFSETGCTLLLQSETHKIR